MIDLNQLSAPVYNAEITEGDSAGLTLLVYKYKGGFIFAYGGAEMQDVGLYGKLLITEDNKPGRVVPFTSLEEAIAAGIDHEAQAAEFGAE